APARQDLSFPGLCRRHPAPAAARAQRHHHPAHRRRVLPAQRLPGEPAAHPVARPAPGTGPRLADRGLRPGRGRADQPPAPQAARLRRGRDHQDLPRRGLSVRRQGEPRMSRDGARLRGPWLRAPISVQLVTLLIASLLVSQAISVGIILLIPPPRPPVYRVAEVAAAIRGGALKTRFGRPLVRQTADALPPELIAPHREHQRTLAALARTLGAPEARVRLEAQNASPIWRLRRA